MAEGLLRAIGGSAFEVHSAGTRATAVRPEAIAVMRERGIDISAHRSKHLEEFAGQLFDYVITVCDAANDNCPVFPGQAQRIHWSFPDPAAVDASDDERMHAFRSVRDALEARITAFVATVGAGQRRA